MTTFTNAGFGVDGTVLYGAADLGNTVAINLVGDPAQGAQAGDRALLASASEALCFNVKLPLAATNAAQGLTTTAPLVSRPSRRRTSRTTLDLNDGRGCDRARERGTQARPFERPDAMSDPMRRDSGHLLLAAGPAPSVAGRRRCWPLAECRSGSGPRPTRQRSKENNQSKRGPHEAS